MEKYRAIPQGYMTVGQLAKKMNTTVRTLQYYDNEGLLSPSSESEGGRRLYTGKDVIMLHQIQAMKYLGFSLDDIKEVTGGDISLMSSLMTIADKEDSMGENWKRKWLAAEPYIQDALKAYFSKNGINPFEGAKQ